GGGGVGRGGGGEGGEARGGAGDGVDEPGAGLGTERTDVGAVAAVRDENFAVSLGGTLGPRDREDDRIDVRLLIGIWRSEVPVFALAKLLRRGQIARGGPRALIDREPDRRRGDVHPRDVGSHEFADVKGWFDREVLPHRSSNQGFDLGGGNSGDRSCELGLPLDQGRGDVVAVPEPLLAAVARGHAVAPVVENAAAEQ